MKELSRKNTGTETQLPIRMMQFGGGNFLRAFIDWMVQELNEQTDFNTGIAVIKPTANGNYNSLKTQDGLFTVVLDGIKNDAPIATRTLVTCIQRVINPYTDWEEYLALATVPELRFITSNTTEAGIRFRKTDAFTDLPPKEFPAKLTHWLFKRFEFFKGDTAKGCIILPLELIEDNGDVLLQTVLSYANHWKLGDDFKNWITTANYFCSTLVDRIVSGYPASRETALQQELGYADSLLVAGEFYHSWVIQAPTQVQQELPFHKTQLNVSFVSDLAPSRTMKVRVLNGAHTAMVPVAYLAGIRYVHEAMENPVTQSFVKELLTNEVATTLDFSDTIITNFIADVVDRFKNPLLKHQLISIALNSTSKFVSRLLPTLTDYVKLRQEIPKHITLGLAALIVFYSGSYNGEPIALHDDPKVIDFFRHQWDLFDAKTVTIATMVTSILANTDVWGTDMNAIKGLSTQTTTYVTAIVNDGVIAVLNKHQ